MELCDSLAAKHDCKIHLYAQQVEGLSLSASTSLRSPDGGIIWRKVPAIPGPTWCGFLPGSSLTDCCACGIPLFAEWSFDAVLSPGINCLRADIVLVHALFFRLHKILREETESQTSVFRRIHRRLYYRLAAGLERRTYSDPEVQLAAVSRKTAELLGQYFGRKDVLVIPHGVDMAQFSSAARFNAPRRSPKTKKSSRCSRRRLSACGF